MLEQFIPYQRASAADLLITTSDRRRLVDDVTNALGIGGWSCPGPAGSHNSWDVTDADIERMWNELEDAYRETQDLDDGEAPKDPPAFHVALLIATQLERECWTA